jgi:hypothetical protein
MIQTGSSNEMEELLDERETTIPTFYNFMKSIQDSTEDCQDTSQNIFIILMTSMITIFVDVNLQNCK